ncbi:MAG: hypothetical protein GX352_08900 [Clostridiales bacterium]|nr:hypothetical protein [Clostridiales bacterium]
MKLNYQVRASKSLDKALIGTVVNHQIFTVAAEVERVLAAAINKAAN